MKKTQERESFVSLRSQGLSMRAAAGALDVSLSTAERWEEEARAQIAAEVESRYLAVCQRYHLSRLNLLERLGEVLNTLDDALDNILEGGEPDGFHGSTAPQVIGLQLKTMKQIAELLPRPSQAPVSPARVQVAQVVGIQAENGSSGLSWSGIGTESVQKVSS